MNDFLLAYFCMVLTIGGLLLPVWLMGGEDSSLNFETFLAWTLLFPVMILKLAIRGVLQK